MSKIFTSCLKHKYFPDVFKHSKVKTINKPPPQDYTSPKSIRPISLLPVLGKIFERIILERIKHESIKWFSNKQFGFVNEHNTELANLNLITEIQTSLNERGKGLAVISLDITSAFDKAWHPAILHRLLTKKCPMHLFQMMQNYLANTKWCIKKGHYLVLTNILLNYRFCNNFSQFGIYNLYS